MTLSTIDVCVVIRWQPRRGSQDLPRQLRRRHQIRRPRKGSACLITSALLIFVTDMVDCFKDAYDFSALPVHGYGDQRSCFKGERFVYFPIDPFFVVGARIPDLSVGPFLELHQRRRHYRRPQRFAFDSERGSSDQFPTPTIPKERYLRVRNSVDASPCRRSRATMRHHRQSRCHSAAASSTAESCSTREANRCFESICVSALDRTSAAAWMFTRDAV